MIRTPSPEVVWVEWVFEIKTWLGPHVEELRGHSQPHCYRFTTNGEGHAAMHYRQWSGQVWLPENGLLLIKYGIISVECTIHDRLKHFSFTKQSTPESVPEQCTPAFDKVDIAQLRGDMPKWKRWLADTGSMGHFFRCKASYVNGSR